MKSFLYKAFFWCCILAALANAEESRAAGAVFVLIALLAYWLPRIESAIKESK